MRGWGDNPIDRRPRPTDAADMTVLESRYATRDRAVGPAREGGGRFARAASPPPVDDERTSKVEQLRERVRSGAYEVDEQAVAGAILARLAGAPQPGDQCS